MKKISLKNLNLKEVEQLSREQLKDVLGGWTGSTTTGPTQGGTTSPACNCNSKSDCAENKEKPQGCMTATCTAGTYSGGICGWDGTAGTTD
ncbi:hypothetical protein [Pedobacter gandavensis]|uniref:hypothetical protein n=1 Tax=Pedobacter gandavensis TaxID=2679963 RepID=UPI00292F6616|nr:hypothetical protein [Pedobacter gandavensis]